MQFMLNPIFIEKDENVASSAVTEKLAVFISAKDFLKKNHIKLQGRNLNKY